MQKFNILIKLILIANPTPVDSCKGDAGGPLVVIDENNQKRLAGIISWSQGIDLKYIQLPKYFEKTTTKFKL